jgi:protein TonB
MVRTLPPLPWQEIDGKRIAANTLTIALHLAALMILMAPLEWSPPQEPVREEAPPVLVPDIVVKPVDPPPPIRTVVREEPRPQPVVATPQETPQPVEEVVMNEGTELAEAVADPGPPVSFDPGPAVAQLSVIDSSAPRYPRPALQRGLAGTVTLRILVGIDGRPQAVTIEESSGHGVLDEAARRHVLATWTFVPAQRNGQTVAAYALVPIEFVLPR